MVRYAIRAIAPVLVLIAGCGFPDADDIIQWSDDFEAPDLSTWSVTGDVSRVTTYHPGEHAMRLAPGGRAVHGLPIMRTANGEFDDGNWVEFSTDCEGAGALELRAVEGGFALEVELGSRALGEFARHRMNLPPIDSSNPVWLSELALTATTLACRVDNLQVRIAAGQYAY